MARFKYSWTMPITLAVLLVLLYELEDSMSFPTIFRLLEDAICRQHYASTAPPVFDIDEAMCKTNEIQSKLAMVRGWFSLFKTLPGHFWNTFPIQAVWFTSLFRAVGGGTYVILALNMTMVADLCLEETRSQMLYLTSALKYVASFAGPQLASIALVRSLWLPIFLCQMIFVTSLCILGFIPETLNTRPRKDQLSQPNQNASSSRSYRTLLMDWRILLVLVITFLTQFRYLNESILLPYVSVRFSWSVRQISILLSIMPLVSLMLLFLLPRFAASLDERLGKSRQNMFVLRGLLLCLAIGETIMTAAENMVHLITGLVIFAGGNGVRAPLLAASSFYISGNSQTGRLYTVLSMTDALSHMVGDLIIQYIWRAALNLEEGWLMLPYLFMASLYIGAFLASLMLPSHEKDEATISTEEDEHSRSENEPLLYS